jgi:hypothetical protein
MQFSIPVADRDRWPVPSGRSEGPLLIPPVRLSGSVTTSTIVSSSRSLRFTSSSWKVQYAARRIATDALQLVDDPLIDLVGEVVQLTSSVTSSVSRYTSIS